MAITPRRASTTGPARRSSERKSFKIRPAGAPMRAPVTAARAFMGRNPAILEGADPDPIARAAQPAGKAKLGAWLNRHYDVADSLLGDGYGQDHQPTRLRGARRTLRRLHHRRAAEQAVEAERRPALPGHHAADAQGACGGAGAGVAARRAALRPLGRDADPVLARLRAAGGLRPRSGSRAPARLALVQPEARLERRHRHLARDLSRPARLL